MLRIDVDEFTHKTRFELQKILHSMPCPFFVRLSSSRTGLHVSVPLCDEWDYRRYAYDDPMRVDLDTQRKMKRLPVRNLLWDKKDGVLAGHWTIIKNSIYIENFLDSLVTKALYGRRAYWDVFRREQTDELLNDLIKGN